MTMEELHRIHKDVPFGYWVLWIQPAYRAMRRKWRGRAKPAAAKPEHDHLIALR
jgi:hypothetical protein